MDKYAVFGNPISQSKSPKIHALFAQQTSQSLSYVAIEPAADAFKSAIQAFIAEGGIGANVTSPFKLDAYNFADRVTHRAELAGAVNTLKVHSDGSVEGDNTDGQGLLDDLLRLNGSLQDKRILLIGAGGAVRGVIGKLFEAGTRTITICNRTPSKAEQLSQQFSQLGDIRAGDLGAAADHQYDVIINSTSSSLYNELPAISELVFKDAELAYDMVYRDSDTCFMRWAEKANADIKTSDGFGMLVGQAAESFYVWRGVKPDIQTALSQLR